MRKPRKDEWSDLDMLEIMDLSERQGFTAREVAERIEHKTGRRATRSAMLGIIHRINKDTDAVDVSPHLNGTMPERWWDHG